MREALPAFLRDLQWFLAEAVVEDGSVEEAEGVEDVNVNEDVHEELNEEVHVGEDDHDHDHDHVDPEGGAGQ